MVIARSFYLTFTAPCCCSCCSLSSLLSFTLIVSILSPPFAGVCLQTQPYLVCQFKNNQYNDPTHKPTNQQTKSHTSYTYTRTHITQ